MSDAARVAVGDADSRVAAEVFLVYPCHGFLPGAGDRERSLFAVCESVSVPVPAFGRPGAVSRYAGWAGPAAGRSAAGERGAGSTIRPPPGSAYRCEMPVPWPDTCVLFAPARWAARGVATQRGTLRLGELPRVADAFRDGHAPPWAGAARDISDLLFPGWRRSLAGVSRSGAAAPRHLVPRAAAPDAREAYRGGRAAAIAAAHAAVGGGWRVDGESGLWFETGGPAFVFRPRLPTAWTFDERVPPGGPREDGSGAVVFAPSEVALARDLAAAFGDFEGVASRSLAVSGLADARRAHRVEGMVSGLPFWRQPRRAGRAVEAFVAELESRSRALRIASPLEGVPLDDTAGAVAAILEAGAHRPGAFAAAGMRPDLLPTAVAAIAAADGNRTLAAALWSLGEEPTSGAAAGPPVRTS